ncbi:MAG: chemotaxis protein CheW [Leptolyngbyaceae cyanobacterium bins.59]|nr:chemotaxis protein CheW [Leptolyngbyaceae cyanobacterium bins.59]
MDYLTDETTINYPVLNDCWNRIGVMGDRSCGELKAVIHCRNCAVYSTAGRSLFERSAPTDYLKEWTDVLADTSTEQADSGQGAIVRSTDAISIMIFRLGQELLALPVRVLQEVTHPCVIHTLPHRSNHLFLGLVNIRGETLLCASLGSLLGLESVETRPPKANPLNLKRMVVAGREENRWVFPVDEVHGIYRFHLNELKETPVVISKATEAYTKGVINWQDKKVNYLDSDLLFYTLNRRIL